MDLSQGVHSGVSEALLPPQVALRVSPSPASTTGHARTTSVITAACAPLATRARTVQWVRHHPRQGLLGDRAARSGRKGFPGDLDTLIAGDFMAPLSYLTPDIMPQVLAEFCDPLSTPSPFEIFIA